VSGHGGGRARFWYRAVRARLRDDRAEIVALVEAIQPGDAAVDVGANKGSYVPWLSRAAGPAGLVVAFEPQPELAQYLARACRNAGLDNITVEAAGASDRSGILPLRVPGGRGPSPGASFEAAAGRPSGRVVEAPVVALDDYFREKSRRIAAVKIDVEGHELAVLRGARELIERHAPTVVVECEVRHVGRAGLEQVLAYFSACGYPGAFVRRGRLRPVSEFDPDVDQRQSAGRFWDAPGYCNNFVMRSPRG
jgi:FkbM family methyltransferase